MGLQRKEGSRTAGGHGRNGPCPGGGDAGHQAVLFGGPISGACPGGTFRPVTLSPGLRDKWASPPLPSCSRGPRSLLAMSLTSHRRSLSTPRPRSHADDWAFLQEVSEGTVAGPLRGAGGTRDACRARLVPAASGLPASRVFSSNEHGRCGSFCCVLVSVSLTSILIFIVSFAFLGLFPSGVLSSLILSLLNFMM